jgi:hypothetical protein
MLSDFGRPSQVIMTRNRSLFAVDDRAIGVLSVGVNNFPGIEQFAGAAYQIIGANEFVASGYGAEGYQADQTDQRKTRAHNLFPPEVDWSRRVFGQTLQ